MRLWDPRCYHEWMRKFIMYCCTSKALYNHISGSLLNHHQCALSTWMMRPQPQNNCSIHTSYRWRGERERESDGANSVDWWGPMEGMWPGHRGYTPTLYEKCLGIFNDHRESGPQFNVLSEALSLLQYSVPITILRL